MRFHDRVVIADFSTTLTEIADELFARVQFSARWLIAIEISDQTNAERDVVQIVAVHMAAVDLSTPTVSYFDLAIAGRSSVPDHKVICQTVLHPAKMSMIIVECSRIALTRA